MNEREGEYVRERKKRRQITEDKCSDALLIYHDTDIDTDRKAHRNNVLLMHMSNIKITCGLCPLHGSYERFSYVLI